MRFRLALALALLCASACESGSDSAALPPPNEPGPYAIASYEASFTDAHGTFESTIVYPDTPEGGPYPIVSVAPGTCSIREWYTWVGEQLAGYGYVVLTFTPPAPCFGGPFAVADGLIDALDFLVAESSRAESPVRGKVGGERRAIVGHSLGAIAVLIAASAHPELGAAVPLAAGPLTSSYLDAITTPTLLLAASEDGIVPADGAATAYDRLTNAPKELVTIAGGNHAGFCTLGSICDVAGGLLDNPRTLDEPNRQDELMRKYTTAWLERFVRGRRAYDAYLSGAEAQADLDAGLLTELRTDFE